MKERLDTSLPRATVPRAETPSLAGLTALATWVVVVAALYLARDILIPITIAVLLSFVLAPLVELMRRIGLPRLPAVLVSALLALCVVIALGTLIGTQVAQLATDLPRYQTTIQNKLDSVRELTVGRMSDVAGRLGRELKRASESPARPSATEPAATPEKEPIPVEVRAPKSTPVELAQRLLSPILGPLETAGVIFIVTIFILAQREDLRDRLIRLFGSSDLHRTTIAIDDAARRLSRYFLTQLAVNAGFGAVIGIGLLVIGVPSALLWGVLAALLRFVPYIGSFIAAIVPIAVAAAVDPGWSMAIWTALLFLLTEPILGHFVEPMLYGQSTGLSPISVIVSAIFWAWLWGPVGLILSTPLTLCLVVMGRHVKRLEFLDVMLGDRPALTPIENFYQRVLAGDPDEVQEHAELLLRERSLSSYYDEVALKGLQLAAHDVQRRVLTREQLERIREAVRDLVAELDSYEDVAPAPSEKSGPTGSVLAPSDAERRLPKTSPPPEVLPQKQDLAPEWQASEPVLCVAGRGPLDEAASLMLGQLLRKHGLGSRVVSHEAVSRRSLTELPTEGIAMICISYLEISGNPAHLRYLLRRLRQRLPHARFLVGLWPADDAILQDAELRSEVGADDYVTSLRDAVSACLKAAQASSRKA